MHALGVDVGGTFVDFLLFDADRSRTFVAKRSSGADPAASVLTGVTEICDLAGIEPGQVDLLVHGTTIATNALLQYDGAETGLITTEGFRDVLHIGRHQRPENYSIQQDIPWQARPLVKRRHRLCVAERLAPPAGEVVTPLDTEAVRSSAAALARAGIEAVAVCFLFSYLNPEHEREAARIVREEIPGAFVCTSHDVVPQFREFERFTTTAINAFVGPKVRSYVARLDEGLPGIGVGSGLHIMQSNGGTATTEQATARPASLLLSGPVGGVIGGVWATEGVRRRRYLATLDMGGTSADIGIVTEQGVVEARVRGTWLAGYPVLMPTVDIHTIGAGGGSVAYVDQAGAPHVGPRSAGALPGPACYGRGGMEPTVTDAHLVLGHLPGTLAGGLALDFDAAHGSVEAFATALSATPAEAAAGIIDIVNENMAAAMRVKTIERGLDPRGFVLCAFGGAGPLHGAELARLLEMPEVVIPPSPGVTSAAGLLASNLRYDMIQSVLRPLETVDADALEATLAEREHALAAQLRADGCPEERVELVRAADMRYRSQGYELTVPIRARPVDQTAVTGLRGAFDVAHRKEFGHDFPHYEVELVNIRVTALGRLFELAHPEAAGGSLEDALIETRSARFRQDGALVELATPVYDRDCLPLGQRVAGPAIVTQLDSTTLVPPDATLQRETDDNLRIVV
jgi:N-methylhydantoinase A